ncbi:methylated-DNA--[protein]-cysteine S-methyltransferase [Legionella fallonii]|uniref:Methylated DNA protein cysteine S-methyltransferase n=1 Tax=Legionella fallonii LLAP-10 TaxID=1212491 RepID=A0A098G6H3_9GAMM|nr:methylated-DNA--[protein]-cysteine S-methyltransferase [Legionella fallonii]CEG58088.1 Methylated DNA protein cysteine S-methyltransferase [Legionella fallonii LLAP-10]
MNKKLIISVFATPFGNIEIAYDEHFIYKASFTHASISSSSNGLTQLINNELDSYLADPHHRFQLPLKPQGSVYQQKVWNALLVIPVGRTLTYGELALKLQSSPRAVGQACKRNPLVLFIPCHRVVGKNDLGGYMGSPQALTYKESLLAHEAR